MADFYTSRWKAYVQDTMKARRGFEPLYSPLQGDASPLGHRAKLSDQDYIRWLEDPDLTIGKQLRLEIASRLKELTQ